MNMTTYQKSLLSKQPYLLLCDYTTVYLSLVIVMVHTNGYVYICTNTCYISYSLVNNRYVYVCIYVYVCMYVYMYMYVCVCM